MDGPEFARRDKMHITLLCATHRGLRFLKKLRELCPEDQITVFTFREEPWEPKYLDEIKDFASAHGVGFFEGRNVAADKFASFWENPIDLIFVVSWRYLLPMSLMTRARLGSVVFHDSLLPAYRGFAPTVWAIINGEQRCGVTAFHIAEALEPRDVISQVPATIEPEDTIAEVMTKVTSAYLSALEENLPALKEGLAPRSPQDHRNATYTCKRTPEDNLIDWRQSARQIFNLIRG